MGGRFTRRRPSPATVLASLALLVALGGTSVAAVSIVIPAGSVGTSQLKANAVTSAKVKNGSLLGVDFKAGQIPAGPAGATGPAGPAGAAGGQGPAGPSDAYTKSLAGPIVIPNSATIITSLGIPQGGKYELFAKGFVQASSAASVGCALVAESDTDASGTTTTGAGVGTIALNVAHEYGGAGSADLKCLVLGGAANLAQIKITAIKVGNLTTS